MRNATAWGNAPGKLPTDPEALKARHEAVPCSTLVLIPRLQRFDHNSTVNLGRWPRLLHHAPLALNALKNLVDESSMSLPLPKGEKHFAKTKLKRITCPNERGDPANH